MGISDFFVTRRISDRPLFCVILRVWYALFRCRFVCPSSRLILATLLPGGTMNVLSAKRRRLTEARITPRWCWQRCSSCQRRIHNSGSGEGGGSSGDAGKEVFQCGPRANPSRKFGDIPQKLVICKSYRAFYKVDQIQRYHVIFEFLLLAIDCVDKIQYCWHLFIHLYSHKLQLQKQEI